MILFARHSGQADEMAGAVQGGIRRVASLLRMLSQGSSQLPSRPDAGRTYCVARATTSG
jgi:hypothetical protein